MDSGVFYVVFALLAIALVAALILAYYWWDEARDTRQRFANWVENSKHGSKQSDLVRLDAFRQLRDAADAVKQVATAEQALGAALNVAAKACGFLACASDQLAELGEVAREALQEARNELARALGTQEVL